MNGNYLFTMFLIGLVVVGLLSLIPVAGTLFLGPLAAIAVGAYGAWRTTLSSANLGRGLWASAAVGAGALVGTVVAVAMLGASVSGDPAPSWATALGATVGIFVGFALGLFNLVLAVLGGLVGGLLARDRLGA